MTLWTYIQIGAGIFILLICTTVVYGTISYLSLESGVRLRHVVLFLPILCLSIPTVIVRLLVFIVKQSASIVRKGW